MPISNPFADSGPDGGDAPETGREERRPDERDRTRTRARTRTRDAPNRRQAPGAGPTDAHPDVHEAADDAPDLHQDVREDVQSDDDGEAGVVVPFPGDPAAPTPVTGVKAPGGLVPASLSPAVRAWWDEASQTAGRALDGSVWRARPPALRDSAVRLQRAEWAGGLPALRWAGWVYGYPALAVRAVLMGVIWLLDHPTRLLVLAGVVAAALYL